MPLNYRIEKAINSETGERYFASEVFKDRHNAYEFREWWVDNKIKLLCAECYQLLFIGQSSKYNLHFKHHPNSEECILKDENLSEKEKEMLNAFFQSQESPRHKELKNKIGNGLLKTPGVDIQSVTIDNKFIISAEGRRKPDVFCEFNGVKIAFEIQLSQLSYRYIRMRHNFYKENGIYLIWILNDFEKGKQGPLEKNIKHLEEDSHHLFKLDETAEAFKLICNYKTWYLTLYNQLHQKWVQKSIFLKDLVFVQDDFKVYFYDYEFHKTRLLAKQEENEIRLEKERQAERIRRREERARREIKQVIVNIRKHKNEEHFDYEDIEEDIFNYIDYEERILNEELGWEDKLVEGLPIVNTWLRKAGNRHYGFLQFVLGCTPIKLTINGVDEYGVTCLQELYKNNKMTLAKKGLAMLLFLRGYKLTESDNLFLQSFFESSIYPFIGEKRIQEFKFYDQLKNKSLIYDMPLKYLEILCIIESAKCKRIIGFDFDNWVDFGAHVFDKYHPFGKYLEAAFEKYDLMEQILLQDKTATFQRKLNNFRSYFKSYDKVLSSLIRDLYPELVVA